MDKVIIYGIGDTIERVITAFPDITPYIECFVDGNCAESDRTYYGKKVYTPYQKLGEHTSIIVIAATNALFEIYGILRMEFDYPEEKIMYIGEWLGRLIEENNMTIRPQSVRLEACSLCQLNCNECYMRKDDYGLIGRGFLTASDFCGFINANDYIRKIEFSNNGEPFLNPELVDILNIAYEHGIVSTFSNGANFNSISSDVIDAVCKCGVEHITISIDGATQEIYEKYRRGGDFERVISNIRLINKKKIELNSKFPKMTWQYVIMEENETDIENAQKIAMDLQMDIVYKLDWGGNYKPSDIEFVRRVTGLNVYNRVQFRNSKGFSYVKNGCSQMIFAPQINWDGRLLGCCGNYKNDWNINVFEVPLEEALNSKIYKKAVVDYLLGKHNGKLREICKDCSSDGVRGMKKGKQMWI